MLGIFPESKQTNQIGPKGMSLRDVVFILYRRKWAVLVIALPIIVIGGLSLFRQTGSFTARARVVVELAKVDLPRWDVSGRSIDYDTELSTFSNIATSIPVASIAAASLADSIPVIKELDPRLVHLHLENALREYLVGGMEVTPVGQSRILEFRYSSAHPRISLMAVGAMRDAFVDYHINGRRDNQAIAYYDEQTSMVRAEIDSLLGLRTTVHEESGYSSFKHELQFEAGQLSEARSDLSDATTRRRSLEITYNQLVIALRGDPRDFPMGQDESRAHSLINWRNVVGKHEDNLNSLLATHTPESVLVQRQQELVDRSMERLLQEERNYVRSVELTLLSARETEQSHREVVAGLAERNQRAPAAYQRISSLDTEIQSLRGLLEDLQGKVGEVRLTSLADERVSSVSALTAPEMMAAFGGGQTLVYFVMIAIFSLALGIVAAFLLEMMDHRVYAPRDVEEHLQLPVFASVSKVK